MQIWVYLVFCWHVFNWFLNHVDACLATLADITARLVAIAGAVALVPMPWRRVAGRRIGYYNS